MDGTVRNRGGDGGEKTGIEVEMEGGVVDGIQKRVSVGVGEMLTRAEVCVGGEKTHTDTQQVMSEWQEVSNPSDIINIVRTRTTAMSLYLS